MTEAEWLACADTSPMLDFLRTSATNRKLRLFAVACCRRVWHWMDDARSRKAVDVAEQYADGATQESERRATRRAALEAAGFGSDAEWAAQRVLAHRIADCLTNRGNNSAHQGGVPDAVVHEFGSRASGNAYRSGTDPEGARLAAEISERREQVILLRCVFGNPFRPMILAPARLSWSDGTLVRLAKSIYEERTFDRLPILADALEDAGCDNADILAHCRGPGPHVLGCWVVDLMLGKE
jgi:hypothetical protein